jgi:hypothetical protein
MMENSMNRLILFCLSFAIHLTGLAQEVGPPSDLPVIWSTMPALEVGTTHVYDFTREQQIKAPGEPVARTHSGHEVRVTLIEHTNDGLTYQWSSRSITLEREWPELSEALAGMSPIIEFDLNGQFIGVRNWETYQEAARRVTELVATKSDGVEGLDEDAAQRVAECVDRRYETKELVEFAVLSETMHFFYGYGWELETDADYRWSTETPIGLEPTMVPATERLYWDEDRTDETRRVLVWQSDIDRKAAAAVLDQVLRDTAAHLGVEFDEPPIELAKASATSEYVFRTDFGCLERVQITKNVELVGMKHNEERVWSLREIIPPKQDDD